MITSQETPDLSTEIDCPIIQLESMSIDENLCESIRIDIIKNNQ